MWWTFLAALTLFVTLGTVLRMVIGNRRLGAIQDQDPAGIKRWPSISIVVAARNEQANMLPALESLLQLDYCDFELIVVDDRSTDRTGPILDAVAREHSELTVVHLEQLPAGWLGKNHAQWYGAQRAGGEYLLFTDADVIMDAQTLRRAMTYVVREQVDHLAASPDLMMPSLMLQAFVVLFVELFAVFTRPWKVADPNSAAFIGIGAFNLVRAEAYQAVGTHRTIAMRPDDDLKLGKIIKAAGFRQRFLWGTNMIRVPWYGSVKELIGGMEKNAFSGVDYRISLVVAATVVLVLCGIWPFVALCVLQAPANILYGAVVLLLWTRSIMTAIHLRQRWWSALLLPLVVALLIYIQWRAMLLTYVNNGIRWRDTHYSLAELKANKV